MYSAPTTDAEATFTEAPLASADAEAWALAVTPVMLAEAPLMLTPFKATPVFIFSSEVAPCTSTVAASMIKPVVEISAPAFMTLLMPVASAFNADTAAAFAVAAACPTVAESELPSNFVVPAVTSTPVAEASARGNFK